MSLFSTSYSDVATNSTSGLDLGSLVPELGERDDVAKTSSPSHI